MRDIDLQIVGVIGTERWHNVDGKVRSSWWRYYCKNHIPRAAEYIFEQHYTGPLSREDELAERKRLREEDMCKSYPKPKRIFDFTQVSV